MKHKSMKTKYLAIAALALVACEQATNNVEISADNRMLFQVASPSAHTRVSNGAFEAEDRVGVYVTDYADYTIPMPLQTLGNRANNEALIFDGNAWTAERPIYWGEGKSDVYAYYPYIDNVTDVDEQLFSIATDQDAEGAYEASDLLWAKAEGVAQSDGAVSLTMNHAMSRLVVKIMAGEEYVGSLPKDATVHLHSTVTDARLSLANGSVVKDPYSGAKSIKMRNLGIHTFAEGEAVVYEAIVVPQMLETSVPLLEINSKSVSYLLEDMFNFKPGVSYTYTAVLNTSTTAIKVEIGCEVEDWNNIGGGSEGDGDSGSEGGEDDGVDLSLYTDLSAEGTANCYLVQAAGNYKFKAVLGNSDATVGNVKKTEVLWETFGTYVMPNVGDLIASVGYKSGYVYFSTPENFKNGNASIAVRNSKDKILWSWHIWCSEEGWIDQVYPHNAGIMMDRNLGATSAAPGDIGAFGLLYQGQRKDPFMGAGTVSKNPSLAVSTGSWNVAACSNSREFADENPMTFGSDWDGGGEISELEKGIVDPCPAGYRIPEGGFNGFYETAFSGITYDSSNYGVYCILEDGESTAWYPAVGCRAYYTGKLEDVCTSSKCWATSPIYSDSRYPYGLYIEDEYVTPTASLSSGYAYSVRCVKDVATEPIPEPEPDLALSYFDLSDAGTANCYLVKSAGNYKFKAVKGNSDISVGDVAKARVLWETFGTNIRPNEGDLIATVSYKDGYVYFSTPSTLANGNASIAVRNSNGEILWSWHIWCSEEGWNDQVYPNNAGTMMDRNLGAISATPGDIGTFGLLYQWGRKDPFMGSCSQSSNTPAASTGCWRVPREISDSDKAVLNPMTSTTDYSGVASEWFTWEYKKGLHDPCPAGYRVPYGGTDGFWATALAEITWSEATKWDDTNSGRYWTLADGATVAWYPYASYWSATPTSSISSSYGFTFNKNNFYASNSSMRAFKENVRCVKEE